MVMATDGYHNTTCRIFEINLLKAGSINSHIIWGPRNRLIARECDLGGNHLSMHTLVEKHKNENEPCRERIAKLGDMNRRF